MLNSLNHASYGVNQLRYQSRDCNVLIGTNMHCVQCDLCIAEHDFCDVINGANVIVNVCNLTTNHEPNIFGLSVCYWNTVLARNKMLLFTNVF